MTTLVAHLDCFTDFTGDYYRSGFVRGGAFEVYLKWWYMNEHYCVLLGINLCV